MQSGNWSRVLRATCVAVSALAACKGDTGPAGPLLTGKFTGFVVLHDEFGARSSSNRGVAVTADPGGVNSITDSSGFYSLDPIQTGAYTIVYADEGYGTTSRPGVSLVGGNQYLGSIDLGAIATGSINSLVMSDTGSKITMSGTVTAPPSGAARAVRIFIDGTSAVSPQRYLIHWGFTTRTGSFATSLGPAEVQTVRNVVGSGNHAYAVGYVDSFFSNSYVDTVSGRQLFPNLSPNHSDVVQFTVP